MSFDGFGRPYSLKVKHALEMVFLTVPAARVSKALLENRPPNCCGEGADDEVSLASGECVQVGVVFKTD